MELKRNDFLGKREGLAGKVVMLLLLVPSFFFCREYRMGGFYLQQVAEGSTLPPADSRNTPLD